MQYEANDGGVETVFSGSDVELRGIFFGTGTGTGSPAPGPAVVLVPDVHGISPLYRGIAAHFATAGLRTLVLDLYVREGAPHLSDMEAVLAWIADLRDARVLADIGAAVTHLRTSPAIAAEKVGVVGFCLGGQYALMASCRQRSIDACVVFYGMLRHARETPHKLPPPIATSEMLRCPLLALFGADDPLIPPEDVDTLRAGVARSGQRHQIEVFPEAGHAFVNAHRPEAYRPAAATAAMRAATAFLRETLAAS